MGTLTPFADMSPVPRVLVEVPVVEFPAGSVTVSLTRTCEGRTLPVRGAQRMPAASPLVIIDPEPGFGVDNTYTVVGYDATGRNVGSWPVGSTVVEFDKVVIQQPLDPRLSVQVVRLAGTASEMTRETPSELAWPEGSPLPSVIALGPRRGIKNMTVRIKVANTADADTLQATLGTYERTQIPVWLIRTPPGQRIPRILFCHVNELTEIDDSTWTEEVRFRTTITETKPPVAGITALAVTHSDIKVFFSTHTQVKASYATHSDIKRDTSLIGAANA